MATARFHRLRSLSVVGGFLDGLEVLFDAGLNAIIGPRGSGKSTALEFIRFALDQFPSDAADKKRIESLIQHNLKGGCVRLTIETKDGLTYIVSRSEDEEPIVMDSKGQVTDITLSGSSFFKANILSQNEVEGIADNPMDQLRLIDSFEVEAFREVEVKIKQHQRSLSTNAHECIDLQKRMAGLSDELGTLSGIEAKLQEYTSVHGGDAAEINKAHHDKALRDRERRALEAFLQNLRSVGAELEAILGRSDPRLTSAFTRDILEGPNADILRALVDRAQTNMRGMERALQDARQKVEDNRRAADDANTLLATAHKKQELAFQNLLAKHKEVQAQSTERSNLEKTRNDLLSKSQVSTESSDKLKRLLKKREELLQELAALRNQRFSIRKAIAERINTDLLPHIRVRVEQFGINQPYQDLLEKSLKGAGIPHAKVAQKIAGRVAPGDFVGIVRNGNSESLATRAELNAEQARKVVSAVSESGLIYDMESIELPDLPSIELLDGGEYKNSLTLSTGQKCTSILPILLLDSACPLLIDQPEDNLDNRFIYTTVVKRLRQVKKARQLIFLTHNPCIPVLGDAERVIVLKSSGSLASQEKVGTVDQCKKEIVTILEGGEEAFKERHKRYAY